MDDFFDDIPSSASKVAHSQEGLPPIVEVPSDISATTDRSDTIRDVDTVRDLDSVASTARTENSERSDYSDASETQRTKDEYESDEGSTHDEETPRTDRLHRKKHRVKNGRQQIDLTPPEKLLSKAEKKAKKYYKQKKADKAVKEMIRCTALSRIVHGDGHWKLARTHANLAETYLDLKGYAPQAEYHCETAKGYMSRGIQTSSSSTDKANIMEVNVKIYLIMGRALTNMKKYKEADSALTRAENISKERSKIASVTDDDLDEWDIKIFMAIAKLKAKQQKYALAATYFEKVLGIMEVKYGEDSPELIPVYQGLGLVEQSHGPTSNHEKAIEHYLQAHSIASAYYRDRENSIEIAETSRALANAYSKVGTEDAEISAESYLNECLATYQIVYGPCHQKTLDIQDELARLMVRLDRTEEAISLLQSTMSAKTDVYGDLSVEIATTWKLIGSIYLSQGDSEQALRALKKCHNVECVIYGTNHKNSKATQRTLDILLASPSLKSKQKKSKEEALKERPRFNAIVSRGTDVGGFKVAGF